MLTFLLYSFIYWFIGVVIIYLLCELNKNNVHPTESGGPIIWAFGPFIWPFLVLYLIFKIDSNKINKK